MTVADWFVRSPGAAVVDVTPPPLDLRAYRGDDLEMRVTFRRTDDEPYTLDGAWQAQIRQRPDDLAALTAFTVVANLLDGTVVLKLTAAQTLALPARSVWDLQQFGASGTKTWLMGTLYVGGEVTR